MASWRDKSALVPMWMVFLGAACIGALPGVLQWVDSPDDPVGAFRRGVVPGAVFAVLTTLWVAWARRKHRVAMGTLPREDQIELTRAVRTGDLPASRALYQPLLALIGPRRAHLRLRENLATGLMPGLGLVIGTDLLTDWDAQVLRPYSTLILIAVILLLPRRAHEALGRLDELEREIQARLRMTTA